MPTPAGGPLREAILGLLAKDPEQRMDIPTARALLSKAAADRSTGADRGPAAAAVALDRAGRTEALPVNAPAERPGGPPPHDDLPERVRSQAPALRPPAGGRSWSSRCC